MYGDGTEAYTTNVKGVRIRLPVSGLVDGTKVEFHTNMNFTHSGAYHVMFITWGSYYPSNGSNDPNVTEPTGRRIVDHDVPRSISYGDSLSNNAELKVETFTIGSGRGTVTYTYIASEDMWVYERGSY